MADLHFCAELLQARPFCMMERRLAVPLIGLHSQVLAELNNLSHWREGIEGTDHKVEGNKQGYIEMDIKDRQLLGLIFQVRKHGTPVQIDMNECNQKKQGPHRDMDITPLGPVHP
ncbi:MAG: hypothetical protein WGN25_07780 [Candidatus Electrothrix sp. GW3-4]|uniref:hypothetical protein n=1 Tax=Candidatus Electrothrix sp. GW3-4 TaxID=3126740 RepID=UPI0030CF3D8A